jgi:hypothetical protein
VPATPLSVSADLTTMLKQRGDIRVGVSHVYPGFVLVSALGIHGIHRVLIRRRPAGYSGLSAVQRYMRWPMYPAFALVNALGIHGIHGIHLRAADG